MAGGPTAPACSPPGATQSETTWIQAADPTARGPRRVRAFYLQIAVLGNRHQIVTPNLPRLPSLTFLTSVESCPPFVFWKFQRERRMQNGLVKYGLQTHPLLTFAFSLHPSPHLGRVCNNCAVGPFKSRPGATSPRQTAGWAPCS